MNSQLKTNVELMQKQVASLLLYQAVFDREVGKTFLNLLENLQSAWERKTDRFTSINCLQAYGKWFKALASRNQSWQDYLVIQILRDDNPFSQQVQRIPAKDLSPSLIAAAKQDLQVLQRLSDLSSQQLAHWVQEISKLPAEPLAWYQESSAIAFFFSQENWANSWEELAAYYRQHGTGIFAEYRAVCWQQRQFKGIASPDLVQLEEIVGYESQKNALIENTESLIAGYRALNVLLYGSRGSGKSSMVKGLLQKYGDRGLRLIEVGKSKLKDLPLMVEKLRYLPQKFIIYVDDLSFEEDDDAFKSLKVVLEGSLTARAKNVVVYATSNRRHLIREFFSDRPRQSNDEVHAWDSVQEKLSFSDRFGLTLTFEPANQDTYLSIVRHLAAKAEIPLAREELEFRALQWATRHNGRSGRTARQFIDLLSSELGVDPSNQRSKY